MKIVALLGSPRYDGTSAAIARRFLETAAGLGAETVAYELNRLSYRGCQGCYACKGRLDRCILEDDLTAVLAAVQEADAVLFASPVYYGDITAQLKGYIDRTFSYLVPDYPTNPQPSRLAPGKKLFFVLTQGHPDPALFADIFPRFEMFLKWMGFAEGRLLRVCGVGGGGAKTVPEEHLRQAEQAATTLMRE